MKDETFNAEKEADTLMELSPKDAAMKWVQLQNGYNGQARLQNVTRVLAGRGEIDELLEKLETAATQVTNRYESLTKREKAETIE